MFRNNLFRIICSLKRGIGQFYFVLYLKIRLRFLQAANAYRYWPHGRGIYHNKSKTFLVWVNEEDHLKFISTQKGGNVGQVLERLSRAIELIEGKLKFKRDERLGWLTFCPTNLGTAIHASTRIMLPKISSKPNFKECVRFFRLTLY
jgi:protein-arginine kinase